MTTEFPTAVDVVESGDGVRYVLPKRPLSLLEELPRKERLLVKVVQVFFGLGVIILSGMVMLSMNPLRYIQLRLGRTELELSSDSLRRVIRIGPFRFRRQIAVGEASRLVVGHLWTPAWTVGAADEGPVKAGFADLALGCGKSARVEILAAAYPRHWLVPLAQDLARRIVASRPRNNDGLPVVDRSVPAGDHGDTWDRPSSSKVKALESASQLRLDVPPLGLTREDWENIAVLSFFVVVALPFGVGWILLVGNPPLWAVDLVLFVSVFGSGATAAALLHLLHNARSHSIINVVEDRLEIVNRGPLGKTQQSWARRDVADIYPGDPSWWIGGPALQIYLRNGRFANVLVGHDRRELRWIATIVRAKLQLRDC